MRIYGLEDFRLSPAGLKRLGDRPVRITVQQRGISLASLQPLSPAERQTRRKDHLQRGFKRLTDRWPDAHFKARGDGRMPWTLDAVVPAHTVEQIARLRGVSYMFIKRVKGLQAKSLPPKPRWFCVWARVAIQIEGQRSGMIDVEDQLVLVKARTRREAKSKLSRRWRQYRAPYLNPYGHLVRWQFTDVEDIYELFDEKINPAGTEVYSRIRKRKMRAADRWKTGKRVV